MILRGIISLMTCLALVATLLFAVPSSAANALQVLQGKELQSVDAPTISASDDFSFSIDDARLPSRPVVMAAPSLSVSHRSMIESRSFAPGHIPGAETAQHLHVPATEHIFLLLAELLI
jgi:hypothetical protein